MVVCTSH